METKVGDLTLYSEDGNAHELILEDEELTLRDLMDLNIAGFVYHSSQYNIDFEDEDEYGNLIVKYMDIHYFSFTDPKELHKHQLL